RLSASCPNSTSASPPFAASFTNAASDAVRLPAGLLATPFCEGKANPHRTTRMVVTSAAVILQCISKAPFRHARSRGTNVRHDAYLARNLDARHKPPHQSDLFICGHRKAFPKAAVYEQYNPLFRFQQTTQLSGALRNPGRGRHAFSANMPADKFPRH